MTEYWVSNSKQWCRDCKMYIDSDFQKVKKHEAGAKHKKSMERRRNMLWKQTGETEKMHNNFEREMERVNKDAIRSFKNDKSYFSQFKDPSRTMAKEDTFLEMANFSKFPPTFTTQAPPVVMPPSGPVISKEFKPPPGMKTTVEAVWIYKDEDGYVQGPWKLSKMVQWYEEGFFGDDVCVRNITSSRYGWRRIKGWVEIVGADNVEEVVEEKTNVETKSEMKNFKKDGEIEKSTGVGKWTPVPSNVSDTVEKVITQRPRKKRSLNNRRKTITTPSITTKEDDTDGSSSDDDQNQSIDDEITKEAIASSLGKGNLYDDRKNLPSVKLKTRRKKPKKMAGTTIKLL